MRKMGNINNKKKHFDDGMARLSVKTKACSIIGFQRRIGKPWRPCQIVLLMVEGIPSTYQGYTMARGLQE